MYPPNVPKQQFTSGLSRTLSSTQKAECRPDLYPLVVMLGSDAGHRTVKPSRRLEMLIMGEVVPFTEPFTGCFLEPSHFV